MFTQVKMKKKKLLEYKCKNKSLENKMKRY